MVIFFIDNLKGGGAEKAVKIVSECLKKRGYNVALILLENQIDYVPPKDVPLYYLTEKISKFNFMFLYPKFVKLLKRLKPDILFAVNSKSHVLSLFAKRYIRRLIINIQVDLKSHYNDRKYIYKLLLYLYRYADDFVFLSQGIYESLKTDLLDKRYKIIPNPVDFDEIERLKFDDLKKHKQIFSKFTIVNIGRLTEQKGQWILLKAFSRIKSNCNLVILGAGENENELKRIAKELNIAHQVYFLGFQKNPFKFLYHSDIFILSSLWEGFGNVIIEAMACELPIISTDCPSGPREILASHTDINLQLKDEIEFAKFGILTPVGNIDLLARAMQMLIENKELRDRYRELALTRAKDFDKDIIVQQYIELMS